MTRTLGKDLLDLESLTGDQIRLILDTAEPFKEISERAIKKVPALRGQTIVNLPDGKIFRLYVDDEPFSIDKARLLRYERAIDMSRRY